MAFMARLALLSANHCSRCRLGLCRRLRLVRRK